ncbi:hypothetical protein HGM15179_003062 [Zosterops borbonicus]|uniref:Stromal cell-derived factor 1 n=1 Tax=Zosterops borbonicus TaxID=364589 RepID=A0A8K1GVA3_9PASS|nr:hypothetical protein HGM15179_003062 [Zosterops borbonicus]
MDLRALALLAFALAVISLSEEKPVSLTYRCPCRFYESNVARANIKHLKILSTPNCSLQIVARLKSNSKQVCIDPKLKWIQEYLEKALNNSLTSMELRVVSWFCSSNRDAIIICAEEGMKVSLKSLKGNGIHITKDQI